MGNWTKHVITIDNAGLYDRDCGPGFDSPSQVNDMVLREFGRFKDYFIPPIIQHSDLSIVIIFNGYSGHTSRAFAFGQAISQNIPGEYRDVVQSAWSPDNNRLEYAVWRDGKLLDSQSDESC